MADFRPWELSDYFAILRRRKWMILVPLVVIPIATFFVLSFVRNIYRSETFILVEQQKVPAEFVRPIVQTDLSVYLQTLTDQVLSRTRLQSVIERLNLRDQFAGKGVAGIIDELREAIEIELVQQGGRAGSAGFRMAVEAQSPEMAQSILQEITSLLIEENLRVREQQVLGTTQFLAITLEGARVELQEQEKRLREFKTRYFGELPQQQQTNLALLGQYHTQLAGNMDTLNRLEQEKTYLQSMLAAHRAIRRQQEDQMQSMMAAGTNGSGWVVGASDPNSSGLRLRALQAHLVSMEARYTPDHPDVARLKTEIAELRGALSKEEEEVQVDGTEDAVATLPWDSKDPRDAEMVGRMGSMKIALENAQEERKEIQNQIRKLQGRVNISPVREQQLAEVTRDYEVANAQYDSLLRKKNESVIAADLERRQQGQRFRVLDPPSLPKKPSKPNRPLLNLAGEAAGLCFGLGLAGAVEMKNVLLWNQRDVSYYLSLPTLATIPRIRTSGAKRRVRNGASLQIGLKRATRS